jgi:adenylosuccinate lyase
MKDLHILNAISPIDGRYFSKVENLTGYYSEEAIIKYRIAVEIEYFIRLVRLPLPQLTNFPHNVFGKLRAIYTTFSSHDAEKVKEIEKITNHDVKAVEYFIAEHFRDLDIAQYRGFIHFGLTSQDINNTAFPWAFNDSLEEVYFPALETISTKLKHFAKEWKNIPMLSRTHGQAASPTLLGKELNVFAERIQTQLEQLHSIPVNAKFGGAIGNLNAHYVAYPHIDWIAFANEFVDSIGLIRQQTTTQIEHYDNLAGKFQALSRINTILMDLSKDIWTYISMDYFKQKIKKGEIGSSTMPHKVNPIDFENAEGNLGIANALFQHLSNKLPISRLQRDLTDSTVIRNIGVPIAHTLIAFASLNKGLSKLLINEEKIRFDLENHWEITAEAIQTVLRREMIPDAYELLKELTRKHQKVTAESMAAFIDKLPVKHSVKNELKAITPFNYTGKTPE